MESRLEEVTRRLRETEVSLANIYQQGKPLETSDNKYNSTFYGTETSSSKNWGFCHQPDSRLSWLNESEESPSEKIPKPFFDPESLKNNVEQVTPMGSEVNFEADKLVSSTPKNILQEEKLDWKRKENFLKERILDLQSELKDQDEILREAEERFERAQQETANAFQEKECLRDLVADLTTELTEMKQIRKREKEDIRQQFGEYQMSSKERNQMLENKMVAANAERNCLLRDVGLLQAKLDKVTEQTNYLKIENSQITEEKKRLEQENNILKTELSSSKKSSLFNEATIGNIEEKNLELERQLAKKSEQLKHLEVERDDIRTAFEQYLRFFQDIAGGRRGASGSHGDGHQANKNISLDSGNLSWKNESKAGQLGSKLGSDLEPLLKISIPNAFLSLLTDLQTQFTSRESVVQRMNATIESLEQSLRKKKEAFENLKEELRKTNEKSLKGDQQLEELSNSNEFLRQQARNFEASLESLKFQLAESEAKSDKMDFCLGQRNAQVIELQEEMNKKAIEVSQLERKFRNKSCEVSSLESQLDEKLSDFSNHLLRYKGIEKEMEILESQSCQWQTECSRLKSSVEKLTEEKVRTVQECEGKMEEQKKVVQTIQENSLFLEESNRNLLGQIDILEKELSTKTGEIKGLELAQNQIEMKLSQKSEQLDDVKLQLNFQTTESQGRVNQMEKSIEFLKAEINRNLQEKKENKNAFMQQIAQHVEKEKGLVNQMKILKSSLKTKENECIELEESLKQNQIMLEQSNQHISQLEESQNNSQKDMSKLEQHLLVERSQQLELVQSLKQKSDHFQKVSDKQESEMKTLNATIRELQSSKVCVEKQFIELKQLLQQEEEEGVRKAASLAFRKEQAEKYNQEMVLLKSTVCELQDHMKVQIEEIKTMDLENKELKKTTATLKVRIEEEKVLKEKLRLQILDFESELKGKEEMFKELGETIRKLQNEILEKDESLEELQGNLNDQRNELEKRDSKVSELVSSMSNYQSEMEQRVGQLENRLKKAEDEVKQRTEQIRDYKEQYETTFVELQDKANLLEHSDQTCHKLQLELTDKKNALQNLTKTLQNFKEQDVESQRNKTEITQQLRLTRERLQNQTSDFVLVRHQLQQLRMEHDKLVQQIDNMAATTDTKERNNCQLMEELNELRLERVQRETKMAAEVKQLEQELKMEKQAHLMELERLKETQVLLQSSKDELCELLNETNREKLKNGTKHEEEMNLIKASLHLIEEELRIQKENVASLNEAVVLKDVTISKLMADLNCYEKKFLNLKILHLEQNASLHNNKKVTPASFTNDIELINLNLKGDLEKQESTLNQTLNFPGSKFIEVGLNQQSSDRDLNSLQKRNEEVFENDVTPESEHSSNGKTMNPNGPSFDKIRKMLMGLTSSLSPLQETSLSPSSPPMEIMSSTNANPTLFLESSLLDTNNPEKEFEKSGKASPPESFPEKLVKSDPTPTFDHCGQDSNLDKSAEEFTNDRQAYLVHLQQRIDANVRLQEEIDAQLKKLQPTASKGKICNDEMQKIF